MNCLQTELTITGNVYLGCCPKFLPSRQILSKSPSLLVWSPSKAQRLNTGVEEGPWVLRHETKVRKAQICSAEVSWDLDKSRRDTGRPEGSLKPPVPRAAGGWAVPCPTLAMALLCCLPALHRGHHTIHELRLSRFPSLHEVTAIHTWFFTHSLGSWVNAGGYTA